MKCELVRFDRVSASEYVDYIQEWENRGERVIPSSSRRDGRSFAEMSAKWRDDETAIAVQKGFVPSTLYFLVTGEGRILGAIHFRHHLNDRLRENGGHIGYGVRSSERRKGYGRLMLQLLLDRLRAHNVERVMLTCDEMNVASRRTIERCGGVLAAKVDFDGVPTRQYWIEIRP